MADAIASDGGATVIDMFAVAVCAGEALSVTETAKALVPVLVGVPDSVPDFDSDMPAGRLPDATDHE